MFRSSVMKLGWWKYVSSRLWGVHIFDDVPNILGMSYITWWHMNQRFEAACCKICACLLKDGQTQNQLALCKGLQEQVKKERGFHSKFRAGDESWACVYSPGTKQQSSQWKSHPPAIQESWGRWSQTSKTMLSVFFQLFRRSFFSSVLACKSTVLCRSTKGLYGSCWE